MKGVGEGKLTPDCTIGQSMILTKGSSILGKRSAGHEFFDNKVYEKGLNSVEEGSDNLLKRNLGSFQVS